MTDTAKIERALDRIERHIGRYGATGTSLLAILNTCHRIQVSGGPDYGRLAGRYNEVIAKYNKSKWGEE